MSEISELVSPKNTKMITELQIRVNNGVRKELLPLLALDSIGRVRARALFNAGFTSQNLTKKNIVEILKKIMPDLSLEYVPSSEDIRDYKVGFQKYWIFCIFCRLCQILNHVLYRKLGYLAFTPSIWGFLI